MDAMNYFCVFFVNRGYLLSLDISLAVDNVHRLQQSIQDETGVKPSDQVLLVQGGQTLEPNKQVSYYVGAGTEHNPVYLYDRRFLKSERDDMSNSQDLKQVQHKIDEAIEHARLTEQNDDIRKVYLDLPDRARDCRAASTAAINMCARMVQEHGLLNHGWSALVANMDDSVVKIRTRAMKFQKIQEKVSLQRTKATQLLQGFDVCMEQLQGIKLPATLLASAVPSEEVSLYDWISKSDPNYSLQDLVDQVSEQFEKLDEWDSKRISQELDRVAEFAKNDDYREIRGINMRLNQLDDSLNKAENFDKNVQNFVSSVVQTPQGMDEEILKASLVEHQNTMLKIYDNLHELKKVIDTFYISKFELLQNIRARLNGWIVTAYEKLHIAHKQSVVYEEKYLGFRQRLDLVQQIKEAPVIFATAITEIIRRNRFQREFSSWQSIHGHKCTNFSAEEHQIRDDFGKKLEKHFLRVLFPGMFDTLPPFYVSAVPRFDQNMPEIDANYLRSMREGVTTLAPFLKVTSPQVFERLVVRDPASQMQQSTMGPGMRREDSFFTHDPINNMATLHKNFPSGMWLAGDDTMDMSPSAIPAMLAKSPPNRFGPPSTSMQSLHIQNAPSLPSLKMHELDEDEVQTLIADSMMVGSAPIQIPHMSAAAAQREMSKHSSRFSTPDDHFEKEQFKVDDISERSITLEHLKPVASELIRLKADLDEIRAEMLISVSTIESDLSPISEYTRIGIERALSAESEKHHHIVSELNDQLEGLQDSFVQVQSRLLEKDIELEVLNERIVQLESDIKTRDETIKDLQENAELHDQKVKETRGEVYKQLTIEYELAHDDLQKQLQKGLDERDEKIRHLQKEIEKRNCEFERLRADPDSEDYRSALKNEIRQELEKEFKNKIELITKGLEKKNEDTLARFKKDFEYDSKRTALELQHKVKWLTAERDRLRNELGECAGEEAGRIRTESLAKEIQELALKEAEEIHVASSFSVDHISMSTQTEQGCPSNMVDMPAPEMGTPEQHSLPTPPTILQQSSMEQSMMPMAASQFFIESVHASNDDFSRIQSAEGLLAEAVAEDNSQMLSIHTQTRLMMKNVDLMVSIQDIGEGSTVLVVWDDRHNAYILFCNSPYIHFVKETSVRRLGLSAGGTGTPRRNWILGRVVHVDLCVIRKPDNRYRLPVDARVYRVEVDQVPFDSGRPRASTTSN